MSRDITGNFQWFPDTIYKMYSGEELDERRNIPTMCSNTKCWEQSAVDIGLCS
jgi:hypothetical protein